MKRKKIIPYNRKLKELARQLRKNSTLSACENKMVIKERRHRLPKEFYKGEISAAFTLCLRRGVRAFSEPEIVSTFTDTLTSVIARTGCIIPVY